MNRTHDAALMALGALAALLVAPSARPADTPPTSGLQPPVDESVLGTIDVNGSATAAPLPKLAVMPIVTTGDADTTLQLVVKKDLDLSGQYEVIDDSAAPSGLYLHESPVDVAPWRSKGVAVLVRVLANKLPSGKIELLGSAYFPSRGKIRFSSTASKRPRLPSVRHRTA